MTEGDKAFFKRRLREELRKAWAAPHPNLRDLHLKWAALFQDRLDGVPRSRLVMPPRIAVIEAEIEADQAEVREFPKAA